MPIQLTGPQGDRTREAVAQLGNRVTNVLKPGVSSPLGQHAGMPRALTDFEGRLSKLRDNLQAGSRVSTPVSIPDKLAPMLATVTAYYRRRFVTDLERQRARAVAGELLRNIDAAKEPLDDMLRSEWYRKTSPVRLPRVRDFVVDTRSDAGQQTLPQPPRHLDDKFGILWSASHILPDLEQTRDDCEERFAPVAIAFVDVDGLKALNSELGETWVDALVLPPLMRSIEAAVYGHGRAYRHGGDEFVVLSPSADETLAATILRRPREDLARTPFDGVARPPTLSAGLCVVHPDSPVTDREAVHWAALAKKEAKTRRDVVAVVHADREIDPSGIKLVGQSQDG